VLENLGQIGTKEFLPQPVRLAAKRKAQAFPPVQELEIGETQSKCSVR
jgi:hypothetical protein